MLLKRALIWTHRWLGILLGLMIVVWFASGIAMIYLGGMPRIGPQARLDHLPVLDVAAIRLTPKQAGERIGGEDAAPGAPTLSMIQGRPAYRFRDADFATVFADDGTVMPALDEAAAARVAKAFLREPAPELRLDKAVGSPDQWTLTFRGIFPLLKFDVNDARGTQLYVSTVTGEVAQATTRADRAAAWISTIPHWLYFAALRLNQPVWYQIVIWLSALACVLTVLGLVLAFTQYRRPLPYRRGMRWHYIAGAAFGVFGLTWAFSGWVSMEPMAWLDAPEVRVDREALAGGAVELGAYDNVTVDLPALVAPRFIKEISFTRIHGGHYLSLRTSEHADARTLPLERLHAPYDIDGRAQDSHVLVNVATLSRRDALFGEFDILERLSQAQPHRVVSSEVLYDYDDYYYSRSRQTPLPVVRAKLDDPLQSWLYVDMRTSQLVANVHKYSRVERWLYSGLHSLDFRFWYAKRPLWDFGMLVLLSGGLIGSSLGLYYGIRRVVRDVRSV